MLPTWITNWFSTTGIAVEALTVLLFSGCLAGATGCTIYSNGGSEMGLGYRSESKAFIYHQAEEGNKAKASASSELSEPASEWLFNKDRPQDPSPEVKPVPSSADGVVMPK